LEALLIKFVKTNSAKDHRGQAYEISNKRWKYDTEELMRFLIKSVGIPPKTYTSAIHEYLVFIKMLL
jgi:hypothetical protein